MTETTRRSLDKDPVPHASPQSAQGAPGGVPSNEIKTPTSTTRDSHDSSVQASLPQPAPLSDSLDELLSQEVLEIICLHQAIFGYRKPATLIGKLKAKGKDAFMEDLALPMEGFYLLPFRGEPVSKGRIKDLQQQCGLIECPRNEQPTSDSPDSRRSISCSGEVYERVLVLTAQDFGRLGYTLPANMSHELPKHLALLISFWEDRRMRGEDIGISKSELDGRIKILRESYSSLFPDQHS